MLQLLRTTRPHGRRAIGRTLLAAALLSATAVVPAAASAPRTAHAAPAPTVRSTPTDQLVSHFYGSYIDAVAAEGGGKLASALRTFYLTPGLRDRLRAWENKQHADGVLRAQDVPRAYRVTQQDSGAGHTWATVRLTWGSTAHPAYTYLKVQSELATGKISDIRE